MTKLIINPEFRNLLWPLTIDEYNTLSDNIIKEGCRDSIVVWKNTIVDGHNRYNICIDNNITFTTSSMCFDSVEEAKDWIDKNQVGRRNVTPDQLSVIRGRMYNRTKKEEGFQKAGPGRGKTLGQNDLVFSTAATLATKFGVSEATIKRDGKFAEEVEKNEELKKAIQEKKSVADYKKEIKERNTNEYREREAKLKDTTHIVITKEMPPLHNMDILEAPIKDNSIDVILTDPPYPKEYLECWNKLAQFASKKLRDGGILLAMSGQSYLPEVYKRMSVEGLNYYWTGCIHQPEVRVSLHNKRFMCRWKPLLWYVKGKYKDTFQGTDVFTSPHKDTEEGQKYHKWGQSMAIFDELVKKFSYVKKVICDPYMGGGTTIIASLQNKRKAIGIEIDKNVFEIAKRRISLCLTDPTI